MDLALCLHIANLEYFRLLWGFHFQGMYSDVQDDGISSIQKIKISALSLKSINLCVPPFRAFINSCLPKGPTMGATSKMFGTFEKTCRCGVTTNRNEIIEFCLNVWEFLVVPKPVQTARQGSLFTSWFASWRQTETVKGKWKVGTSPSRIRGWNGTFPDNKNFPPDCFPSRAVAHVCNLATRRGPTRKMWKFPLYLNFRYGSKAQTVRDSSQKNKNLEKHS